MQKRPDCLYFAAFISCLCRVTDKMNSGIRIPHAGLRIDEICALSWDDINLKKIR